MKFSNNINTCSNIRVSNIFKFKDFDNDNSKEKSEKDDSMNETKNIDNEDDISVALNKQINELKAEYSKTINARRFQVNLSDIFVFERLDIYNFFIR